jgi:hypothetical protein
MSLTAPERDSIRIFDDPEVDDMHDAASRSAPREGTDDTIVVTCAVCDTCQHASGRSLGYTCHTCGSAWRVLRCRGCVKASIVLDGVVTCPRCGHDHGAARRESSTRAATWLNFPNPLSVWFGGVKYLGGHILRDQPVGTAGLLLDRRGIHLRAFTELFSIRWETVLGIDIEGPQDIAERMTTTRLLALGATTWALAVSYLTVHTENGDAVFEVDGLGPPELHARLSRVLQGLKQAERPPAPIAIERHPEPAAIAPPEPEPEMEMEMEIEPISDPGWLTEPVVTRRSPDPLAPMALDPERSDAPIEVLVVDALWKLAHLREVGLLSEAEMSTLRTSLLARLPGATAASAVDPGPLLHV